MFNPVASPFTGHLGLTSVDSKELYLQWINKLGERQQSFKGLFREDRCCALGALAEVLIDNFPDRFSKTASNRLRFIEREYENVDGVMVQDRKDCLGYLPVEIWLELDFGFTQGTITCMNDESRRTFPEIAEWLTERIPKE